MHGNIQEQHLLWKNTCPEHSILYNTVCLTENLWASETKGRRDGKGSKLESNIPGWAQGTYKLSGEREVVMCVYTHQNARAECQSERITLQVVQEEE